MYLSGNRGVQKYADCAADRFRTDKKRLVKKIFVDESLLKIDGQNYWLRVTYEPNLNASLMMVHLSRERRTIFFVCYRFFKQLRRNRYGRKPIITDSARWYDETYKWFRIQHSVYGTKLKNIIERFIQYIKYRTECFDDHFPCRKQDCDIQHVWNWLRLFMLYLSTGMNRNKFTTFLARDEG